MKPKIGKQWTRVMGDDLDKNNEKRRLANQSILKDPIFIKACELVGIEPTKRQASKWRRKTGKAYIQGRKV